MNFLYSGQGKKINGSGYEQIIVDQYAYQFVAYNEYEGLTKTAKFSELIYVPDTDKIYRFPTDDWQQDNISRFNPTFRIENVSIRRISQDALIQLKDFLDKKRNQRSDSFVHQTFCNTIYTVVEQELKI
jgi:hypothetical protein